MLKIRKRKLFTLSKFPLTMVKSDFAKKECNWQKLLIMPDNAIKTVLLSREIGLCDDDFARNTRTVKSVYLVYTFKRK